MTSRSRRARFIPQQEAAECGAACLAMVLDAYGSSLPLSEVRAACGTGRDGVSAARIFRAAVGFGLEPCAFRLEPQQLAELSLPAILHWEFNHFLVLEQIGRRSFGVIDPALGHRRLSFEALSEAFTGVALCFNPGPLLRRRPRSSPSLARYSRLITSLQVGWISLAGSALILEILALALPAADQVLIDHVLLPRRERWLWLPLLLLGICVVASMAVTAVRDRVIRRLHFALDLDLMVNFVRHLMALPVSFFQQRSSGDLLQRVTAQSELREVLVKAMAGVFDALLLVGYAAMMFAYNVRIGAAIVGMALLRVASVLALRPHVVNATTTHLAERGKELGALLEPLVAPELVRALGAEELAEQRYHDRFVARLNAEVRREALSQSSRELSGVLGGLSQAAAIFLGGRLVLQHEITLGVFSGLIALQALFAQPLTSLIDAIAVATRARGVLASIDDVLATPASPAGTKELMRPLGEIEFEGVTFRYGSEGPVLCDEVSFRIGAGEKVAIVGRSGQGKSTLLKLMTGLVAPERGRVLIAGVCVNDVAPEVLKAELGIVLQDPFLFDDTVRANLALCWPDAPEAELRRAAELACVAHVIDGLPEGWDSLLGDNGVRLSGGERQRLALARALVMNPRVLILDEATASLDLATEANVHGNLRSLGCTQILIAHRMETVRDADRIFVFEQGRIVQEGDFESLRQQPGPFAELLDGYERGAA